MKCLYCQILTSFKGSEKQLSRKGNFCTFCKLIALTLGWNSFKSLRVTKNVKEIKFEGVWDELESKNGFQRQSVTKYLRLTLVLGWNSAPLERFNHYISGVFC